MNSVITVTVNGKAHKIAKHSNLAEFFMIFPPKSTFACALNGTFVSKDEYQHKTLTQGDNIDLLMPIVGG